MHVYVLPLQTASIAVSLLASGGIAALSLFDVPELRSQPASRSLPSTRWLFSRGSHIFPQAAIMSSIGFVSLAVTALPPGRTVSQILKLTTNGSKVNGYLAAAVLNFAIAPFTSVMIPTNFRLIEMNEQKGGARSQNSAAHGASNAGDRSAEDSVNSKGDINEFTDLSDPQGQTIRKSTKEEDDEVQELLLKFGRLNAVRALLTGAGGIVGLVAALA